MKGARIGMTTMLKFKPTDRGWRLIQADCRRLKLALRIPGDQKYPKRDSRGYVEATFCEFTQWLGLYLTDFSYDPVIEGDVILLEGGSQ